jgi:hypothetical protein
MQPETFAGNTNRKLQGKSELLGIDQARNMHIPSAHLNRLVMEWAEICFEPPNTAQSKRTIQ